MYNWVKVRDADTVKREVREGFGDLIQFLGGFTLTTDSHSQKYGVIDLPFSFL